MPFESLTLRPGVNVDYTPAANEAGISATALVRFRDGLVEKIGGWTNFFTQTFTSIVRDLHAWVDLTGTERLAIAAESQLSLISNNQFTDITPRVLTTNVGVNLSTTNGQPLVTVVDSGNPGVGPGDFVAINTPLTVGGLLLFGTYAIVSELSATTYTFNAASNATSTVTNGGNFATLRSTAGSSLINVQLNNHGLVAGQNIPFIAPAVAGPGTGLIIQGLYEVVSVIDANTFTINAGSTATGNFLFQPNGGNAQYAYQITINPNLTGAAYGTGTFGSGTYGFGTAPVVNLGSPLTTTDWTLDNFGSILIACPAGGPIYEWDPAQSFGSASLLINAPSVNDGIFVSMPQEIVVAWGASVLGVQDPKLLAWCDAGDLTDWTASATNQAGTYRIPTGSKVIGMIQAPQQGLIWTDVDMYSMVYIGFPLVFGFNQIGKECGLIGRHAAGVLNGITYWMSQGQFYSYSAGGVQPIPCAIWDQVFQNLSTPDNYFKVRIATNAQFNEVAWFFPSRNSVNGENDTYAKYNVQDGSWDYGPMTRSAWIDQSIFGPPIAADSTTGLIVQHETGFDAAGQPLLASFTTGETAISNGSDMAFIDWFHPDFKFQKAGGQGASATVQVTLFSRDYPSGPQRSYGPYTVSASTPFFNPRLRGRYVSVQVSSNDSGSWWRLGRPRFRVAPDGKR